MPKTPTRSTLRAPAPMHDLLNRLGECGALVQDWEVSSQPDGVLVRVRSRESFDSTGAATAAGLALIEQVAGADYVPVSEPVVRARPDDIRRSPGWHAWAEIVLERASVAELPH